MKQLQRKQCVVLIGVMLMFVAVIAITLARGSSAERRYPRIAFPETQVAAATFVPQCIIPEVSPTLLVYKGRKLESKKEVAVQLIQALTIRNTPDIQGDLQQFDVEDVPFVEDEATCNGVVDGWRVTVWSDGRYALSHEAAALQHEDLHDTPPLTHETARQVADAFLETITPLPTELQFSGIETGKSLDGERGVVAEHETDNSMIVMYDAALNGIPVQHAISIEVGADGTVLAMTNRLSQLVAEEHVLILSPREALQKLRQGEGYLGSNTTGTARCYVNSMKLVYRQCDVAANQSYMMPVYQFDGETASADRKTTEQWTAYVEAIRPELLEKSSAAN